MKSLLNPQCIVCCPICSSRLCDTDLDTSNRIKTLLPEEYDFGNIFIKCKKCKRKIGISIS